VAHKNYLQTDALAGTKLYPRASRYRALWSRDEQAKAMREGGDKPIRRKDRAM
jgi:hypothetical protein